jgi:hypothetical protein
VTVTTARNLAARSVSWRSRAAGDIGMLSPIGPIISIVTVRVECQRRGGIALRQLLRHDAVGFVVGPEPAIALGYVQAEEPLGAEIGIVVEGKGCVAVVAVGARAKRSRSLAMGNRSRSTLITPPV